MVQHVFKFSFIIEGAHEKIGNLHYRIKNKNLETIVTKFITKYPYLMRGLTILSLPLQ